MINVLCIKYFALSEPYVSSISLGLCHPVFVNIMTAGVTFELHINYINYIHINYNKELHANIGITRERLSYTVKISFPSKPGGDHRGRLHGCVWSANQKRGQSRRGGGHLVTTPAQWDQHLPDTSPAGQTAAASDWHTHRCGESTK